MIPNNIYIAFFIYMIDLLSIINIHYNFSCYSHWVIII